MPLNQVNVDVDWLSDNLDRDDVVVVDGSWHLPPAKRDPKQEFEDGHIKGARFFDLDKHSDQSTTLAHMMPSAEQFGREMGELGITETDTIVVYDTVGLFSAARIWWMFRQFGAAKTYALDGGLPAWQAAGLPLETGIAHIEPKRFHAELISDLVVDIDTVKQAVANENGALILDARGNDRFTASAPEPRPEVRGGHMPGAFNVHYASLLDTNKKLLTPEQLQQKFDAAGYDPANETIASCGSGVTACIILMALERLGHPNAKLYDGSWSEWGTQTDTPIEVG